jgi:hypothetical protein
MAQVADAPKGRHVKQASALMTLSPVLPGRECQLRRRLGVISRVPALGRPLAELAFIYYGRWAIVDQLPTADGSGGRQQLNARYLLFDTNYNGRPETYLDGFADAIPHRLQRVWGTCVDFEDTVERPDGDRRVVVPAQFREYVKNNELPVLHFYAAYPEATMVTVRQAIAAGRLAAVAEQRRWARRRALQRLVPVVRTPAPEEVGRLTAVRRAVAAQVAALLPRRGVRPFTMATPIRPGETEALACELQRSEADRPLAALQDTHFARFALLPQHLQTLGRDPQDDAEADFLLFTSTPCGSDKDHAKALSRLGPFADVAWGRCAGYPSADPPERLEAWFLAHRLPTDYFVAGYPSLTPTDVRQRLVLRAALERSLFGRAPDLEWVLAATAEASRAR